MRPLVIGVGNRWRRDDGVGPEVVEALERLDGSGADLLVLDGEPTGIVAAWDGRSGVVVVDAIVSGDPPGTVHHLTDPDRLPKPVGDPSSHGAGLAEAAALGRALDRLPTRLVIVGVEPAALDHGAGLSPPVAASLDAVVRLVGELVDELTGEEAGASCA